MKNVCHPLFSLISLFLNGCFEMLENGLVHESATCKVVFALDHSDKGEKAAQPSQVKVALKFMKHEAQWRRERAAREKSKLDPRWVVSVTEHFDASGDETGSLGRHGLENFPFCLVMPRADRSLEDVLNHEHLAPSPDEVHWEEVRSVFRQLAACLQHLHAAGT